ncbi:MAG: ROK family protein [Opitutaceae bacterium]|nr:ROK family protein [Opitutaceae bacterium]
MQPILPVHPKHQPELDPGFLPAALWNRAYRGLVASDRASRPVILALAGENGSLSTHHDRVLSKTHPASGLTLRYVERLLKFLLWQKGGFHVKIAGANEIAARLMRIYNPGGERSFDAAFLGGQIYRHPFRIEACGFGEIPAEAEPALDLGRHLDGCRIGFDLGGSDRKAAAVVDGKVIHSEEIPWNPYFQTDPMYHVNGVRDSLRRAAAHLPGVDAIGGSAAGTYVNNEVRAASLFRGVPREAFEKTIRRMFFTLREEWGGIPFEVVNDGEVTALAGSMWLRDGAVLGISLGTSQAGGYVTPGGRMTRWLNELAFAPVDHRTDAPRDEWSGDAGCGVQYFSQQGAGRLARAAGFGFPDDMPLAECLLGVQAAMRKGDGRAAAVYRTIGAYLGYAVAHYADFYEIRHLLLLGRVMSGDGGGIIIEKAHETLRDEFPVISERMRFSTPSETGKRHGQAVAAASLPKSRTPS